MLRYFTIWYIYSNLLLVVGIKRKRYFQMLVSGLYTPFTLPVGDEAWGPQSPSSITDCFSVSTSSKQFIFVI